MLRFTISSALLALVLAAPAAAQQPDADAPEPAPGLFDGERWSIGLDLAFTSTSGNEDLLLLTTAGTIQHLMTDVFVLELSGRIRYGRSEGERVANNSRGGIKFDLYPGGRWTPFMFGTVERDPIRRLDARANGGGGAKYTFWRADSGEASISVAALMSYEATHDVGPVIQPATGLRGDPIQSTDYMGRWSWRFKGERTIADGVRASNVIFYQPRIGGAGDFLVDSDTQLRVRLNDRLSLLLSHAFQHDSEPAADVERSDQVVQVGISMEF